MRPPSDRLGLLFKPKLYYEPKLLRLTFKVFRLLITHWGGKDFPRSPPYIRPSYTQRQRDKKFENKEKNTRDVREVGDKIDVGILEMKAADRDKRGRGKERKKRGK